MNMNNACIGILSLALLSGVSGCSSSTDRANTVAEGTIYYVMYQSEDGKTGGFTRLNEAKAVPGGNGSWNIDAYGRLTPDFLIITRPGHKDLGPRVIPANRLLDIQFGDGGIKEVDENNPKPAQ
jgi:hypothetical protein